MEAAIALRSFTAEHVRPLLSATRHSSRRPACPRSPPPPRCASCTRRARRQRREVALNPINPANLATRHPPRIVHSLREQPAEIQPRSRGRRRQRLLFVAKPMRVQGRCLTCHGDPAQSPPAIAAPSTATRTASAGAWARPWYKIVAVPFAPPLGAPTSRSSRF
ncbi:MAG: DUF3365 domain-containing protein [Burkholderiaceae bacterium]